MGPLRGFVREPTRDARLLARCCEFECVGSSDGSGLEARRKMSVLNVGREQHHIRTLAQQLEDATDRVRFNLGEGAYSDPMDRVSSWRSCGAARVAGSEAEAEPAAVAAMEFRAAGIGHLRVFQPALRLTGRKSGRSVAHSMAFEPQVPAGHYKGPAYDNKERFLSYWMQVNEVMRVTPERVLEVGIGNGFVHKYLRENGVDMHTCDADDRLEPDTVGLVTELPFEDGEFDVACCFETLEHLPFEQFRPATRELARVARRWVLLSLPDVTPYARILVEWGFQKKRADSFFDLRDRSPAEHRFDGQHYWEVGKRGYPLSRIVSELESAGLIVEDTPRLQEDAWHRFFRCCVAR